MKTIPDAVDVDSTLISGKPEVQLEVDRDTAADLGVRVGDVSQALNTLVAGQEATTFNEGTDQYEVHVRAINNYRTDVEGLKRMIVPSTKVGWVTLDRLVKVKRGNGTELGRPHEPPAAGDAAGKHKTGRFGGEHYLGDQRIRQGR